MAPTVIIVPVPEADPIVDLMRGGTTPGGVQGMPAHVTLIYPLR